MSDAHIGAPEFNLEEGLIAILKNGYEKVYFVGDMFDTWEMKLEKILKRYNNIIDTINEFSYKIVFIKGNHDPNIIELKKIFPNMEIYDGPLKINLNGFETILIHGDIDDNLLSFYMLFINGPLTFICDIGDYFGFNWTNKARLWYYRQKYERFSYNFISSLEKRTLDKFRNQCEILIMGHTHTAKIFNTPFYRYVNCGCLVYKPNYIEYDTDTNKFSLVKI
jgi:UDP-2,3-diacylglucosamine pyrophosphatase LpxH